MSIDLNKIDQDVAIRMEALRSAALSMPQNANDWATDRVLERATCFETYLRDGKTRG